ncbi:P-loop containing nucleoside triphosphate hydrolase protein [Sporodiniella umbellata]|nr:P-loop containing nucleoside triphosphate hydrolase protein [Sporodiniella umbellata]
MSAEWTENVASEIGGYKRDIENILKNIIANQTKPALSTLPRSKGAVLYGKPGSGKTALAVSITKHSGVPYYVLNCSDIFQAEEGASELELTNFFEQSKSHDMCILVLDEIDIIAGKWSSRKSSLDIRILSILTQLIDQSEHNVFILATTSRLHEIDPRFLRSGRLDILQELSIKRPHQRHEILKIVTKALPFESLEEKDLTIEKISKITHGYTPSDLQSVCTQAVMCVIENEEPLRLSHFIQALAVVKPSGLSEFGSKIPSVRFSDIYGLEDIIHELKTCVIQPFENPEMYLDMGIDPPKGILLHGPTGVGKTMLCSALASETGVNFVLAESSQIRSKIVGESEKAMAKLFSQARASSPCILFIDQIDMLLPKRGTSQSSENTSDRIVTSFLTEMDGLFTKSAKNTAQIDLLIVGATNRIGAMDPAVLRPGRFDERIYVPLPNVEQRLSIIKGICSKMPIDLTKEELKELVETTSGWSGAKLDSLLREAAMVSLRDNVNNTKVSRDGTH